MNPNGSKNLNQMASYPLYEKPNSVRRWKVPLTTTSLAIYMLQGDALRMEQFFKHISCHRTTVLTQFEDFNHINAAATDKNRHDKICPWILPRTIAILAASAHTSKMSLVTSRQD